MLNEMKDKLYNIKNGNTPRAVVRNLLRKHIRYCYSDIKCDNIKQYDAAIIRLYHTIEKGLSYEEYRPGFGIVNVNKLVQVLDNYSKKYDTSRFCYVTALSCLEQYIKKNRRFNYVDENLEKKISALPGTANKMGGIIEFKALTKTEVQRLNYEELMENRHSIRHFDKKPVELALLIKALKIAQFTPSACNRQGWKTRIIVNKECIKTILENQNGNTGFGEEIDKFLVITADLCAFQKDREVFQPFIDGGMYAESVLNALHFEGIGSIPLGASLFKTQEYAIRKKLKISESEVLILFIGLGNYPKKSITTRSERKEAEIVVI